MFSIIIPTLDPDRRLTELVGQLIEAGVESIIVVNDGSKSSCAPIFQELSRHPQCRLLHHAVNLGKGRALKTAFNDLLLRSPEITGAVTADGDGQHAVGDIIRVGRELEQNPKDLILGVRDFTGPDVPWKSRFGNNWSRRMFRWMAGVNISDTQTGLRGIPTGFMHRLMNTAGERFEYESTMLIEAGKEKIEIRQLIIDTIYLDNNKGTHFHPLRDSWLIFRVLFGHTIDTILLFCGSALLSAGIDLSCFALLVKVVMPWLNASFPLSEHVQLLLAVVGARIISSFCNYLMNRNIVFGRNSSLRTLGDWRSLSGYYTLCVVIMLASYALTALMQYCQVPLDVVLIKALVDLFLFIVSFLLQKTVIFNRLEMRA